MPQRRERRGRLRQGELAACEPEERFWLGLRLVGGRGRGLGFGCGVVVVVGWRAGVRRCGSRLEGVGELAVGEGCAETLDGDVGCRAVGEVGWFGGD